MTFFQISNLSFHSYPLTCDLANCEVISGNVLGTPGVSLNTIKGSCLQVLKENLSVCGVEAALTV